VTVTGPDGLPYRVAAKTLTGPDGSVTFDYGLILRPIPKLLMALVAHETGHKVEFSHGSAENPRLYIEDDAPVLAFATGRALLEPVGLAIANFAERNGIIGQQFSVRDKFYCEIRLASDIGYYQTGDDVREFLPSPSEDKPYDAFRTGIGPDRQLQVGVIQGNNGFTSTRWTEAPFFTTETNNLLVTARTTFKSQKAMGQDAALKIGIKLF
jgi:hypothetical protein